MKGKQNDKQILAQEGRRLMMEEATASPDPIQYYLRFRDLLEAAPDAILEANRHGTIVLLNAAAESMFGYKRQELLGQPVELLIPEAMRQRHGEHRSRYAEHPSARPMGSGLELFARRKDGSQFPAEISLSPIRSTQGTHVIAIVRDITARKQADTRINALHAQHAAELAATNQQLEMRNHEVERANQLKNEFLASMSHELRTPLHTIIGFADLLGEQIKGTLNPQQQRFVEHIQRDSRHLLELINDILDLSKIEAGQLELHPESFCAAEAAAEALDGLRPLALSKQIGIVETIDHSFLISADRLRFKEILYNLLSNAIKFTPEKGTIWIEGAAAPGGGVFSVRDTGVGIPASELQAIFDKFYQVSATTRGLKEGTGLGLAITKRLVEMHGGTIRVESKPGAGSRFEVFLPSAAAQPGENPAAIPADLPVVLLVGTDEAAFQQLTTVFEQDAYAVHGASTQEQALQKAKQLRPRAIVLDLVSLGARSGDVLRDLRGDPDTSAIPVIAIATAEDQSTAVALGATAVLTGPVEAPSLLQAVKLHIPVEPGQPSRILVVDDELEARELLAEVLSSAGYLPVLAWGGRQALQVLARTPVAAVIVDLRMPEMSGFELIFRIRENQRLAALPIIVLTGKEIDKDERELLGRQTNAVFLKAPSWEDDLLERVHVLLLDVATQDVAKA
ncbi:MAG TPA: ATP-binding protein [Bryobacteraceae bacterium]|jgi:PAS domain S-box-containing protein